jgi:DNA-binding response OmpR family regulator
MKKVILIEDDKFLSKMYAEKLLLEPDLEVLTLENGVKAIETIRREKPDLILLDIILPDINGVQILKQIKTDEVLKTTRVLMLTNLNEKDYINEAMSLGAEGYLIKAHFTPNEVVDKIRQILRRADNL